MGYKPFPNGTVRGPYRSRNVVTFMVQTAGGWVPFTGTPEVNEEAPTRKRAIAFAREISKNRIVPASVRKTWKA